MSASLLYDVSRFRLVVLSVLRVVLIPALLLCAWPRIKPFFLAEGYSIFFSIILGLSNGILGSVPMIQAPSRVSEQHRELAGDFSHWIIKIAQIKTLKIIYREYNDTVLQFRTDERFDNCLRF